ncbi:DDE-type integrase/transposase/recombinase, partial [Cereibacter sphaeroides]|uniref:DDE-type integrase/transposase/recombinase n=1 Tax=Cereibacter sphaeroides TaxID=1063 RepID=UPI00227832AA
PPRSSDRRHDRRNALSHNRAPVQPPETVARIKALALAHPAYGCNRFEAMLALEGGRVSSITIQKILNENRLGRKSDRWLALEQANADKRIELTPEQAAFIEKLNPCFRERHVESSAPGELLSADTFFVGALKGIGRVHLHAVVDTFGSYAFGVLHVSKQPEAAVAVLHNDVLPFYRTLDLPVGAVLTDNGREFCGTERHPYELYLDLNGIEHPHPRPHAQDQRLRRALQRHHPRRVLPGRPARQLPRYGRGAAGRSHAWLVHYNTERPHLGYRNMGRRPIETVMLFVSQEG